MRKHLGDPTDRPGVALDYDGVIADTNSVKSRWIRRHLRRDVPPWETDRTNCVRLIGIEDYLRMAPDAYGWRASLAARPVPGARRALRTLAARCRVYLLTARWGSMLRGCRAWLRRNGLDRHIEGYLTGGHANGQGEGKAALCAKHGIRALVDDDERHFIGVNAPGVLRILFKNGARGRVKVPRGSKLFTGWANLLPWLLARLIRKQSRPTPRAPATPRRGDRS
jgi:hypothetical protein